MQSEDLENIQRCNVYGVHFLKKGNRETDTVICHVSEYQSKKYLTNVLLFGRRCQKSGFGHVTVQNSP
jgi:hypothetical protein